MAASIPKRHRRSRVPATATCRACGGAAQSWEAVCGVCWGLLPRDLRHALAEARRARAPHLISQAAKNARDWLHAHSPAAIAAKRMGEAG